MASRGKTTQLDHMYVADFETCDADTDEVLFYDLATREGIKPQKVWLAGFKNLDTMESKYFNSLEGFMSAILARGDNSNTEYAFHNLKYDGSYIIPYLMNELGYTHSFTKPAPKQFSVLVDDRNAWYSITIQVTKRRRVLLWDLSKLFPMKLEYLPDVYSTPTKKVKESQSWYNKHRPDGYEPDERDLTYFENDLQVPAETLRKHIELYGLRFKKTQASQSFYNFEQTFKAWKLRFPPLTNHQDESIRPAYWGGISYVPKHKAGKDYFYVGAYDINSSYPDKAANFKLPYGKCVAEYGEGKHPDMSKFWVAEALVEFTLKKDCLPCIPSRAISEGGLVEERGEKDKWVEDSKGIVRMTFCNIDYMTMQKSYHIKIWRWCWSMHWAWKVQKEVARFVNRNNDRKVKYSKLAKKEKDPIKKVEYNTIRNRAKIDNNSFYGKFGEEVIKKGKTPYLEEDGSITWKVDREEVQSERARKYLPVAIAITAWGRQQLVTMANLLGEHFLYCDTDSVHYLMSGQYKIDKAVKEGVIEVDAEKLGAWKFEGKFRRGRYLRPKAYMEQTFDGEYQVTLAGLPADPHTGQFSKVRSAVCWDENKKTYTWDKFKIGYTVPYQESHKLRTVRTPTGNKLLPTPFKIKEKESLFGL